MTGRRNGTTGGRQKQPDGRQPADRPDAQPREARSLARGLRSVSPRSLADGLAHAHAPDRPRWKLAAPLLALAFAARAAVALSGDFVLHPDEIMQYLEPAHRLAFGNGVIYWEYFYGARSWLVPGVVAGVLTLFDIAGLGQPSWYVGGVKLFFCALSLAVPAGMYHAARGHFGETAARVALVAGALWYELAAFAHKPLAELVAMAPLVGLLALCVRPDADRPRAVAAAAGLAVLTGAVRMQYAPLALVLLAVLFLRTRGKLLLAAAAAAACVAVGVFDALTWDGGLFHSYVTNLRFNLVGGSHFGDDPAHLLPWWLLTASGGLSVLCLAAALPSPRRYALLLGLIALTLTIHALPSHKEYRFIFAAIPLWLLIGADLTARAAAWVASRWPDRAADRWTLGVAGVAFAALCSAGVLKALPAQLEAYRHWSPTAYLFGFVGGHDPTFAAYRYLAQAPGVEGVWQADLGYSSTPGYYYLHRAVPLYDGYVGRGLVNRGVATVSATVSHVVSRSPDLAVPGYSLEREFGEVRILRRDATQPPVRRWGEYAPVIVFDFVQEAMARINPHVPAPPANAGIRFDDRQQPAEYRLEQAAQALLRQERFAEALTTYREALQANPDYAPAHAGMGSALFRLERYEEALEATARAIALQPDWVLSGALRRLMGIAAQRLGRPAEAAEHFEQALRIDPADAAALDRLALVRFGQGRYEDAHLLYLRLVEIQPDSAQIHANLGAALYHLNRVDEARERFQHALSLDPSLETVRAAMEQIRRGLAERRVMVSRPRRRAWQRHRRGPFAAVGVTAADLSFYTSREPLELGYTLAERALIASRAMWFYAGDLSASAYLVAAAALSAALWLARRRIGRGPLAGVLSFAVTPGTVMGSVDYGSMQFSFVADRFGCLAGIGVLAVVIGGAAHGMGCPRGGDAALWDGSRGRRPTCRTPPRSTRTTSSRSSNWWDSAASRATRLPPSGPAPPRPPASGVRYRSR